MPGLFNNGSKKLTKRTQQTMIDQDNEINPNPEQINLKQAGVDLLNLMVYRLTLQKLLFVQKELYRQRKAALTIFTCFLIACLLPLLFVDIVSLLTFGEFTLFTLSLSLVFFYVGKGAKEMKEIQLTIETEVKEVNQEIQELIEIEYTR